MTESGFRNNQLGFFLKHNCSTETSESKIAELQSYCSVFYFLKKICLGLDLNKKNSKQFFLFLFVDMGWRKESIAEWLGIVHWPSLGVWRWQSTLIDFSNGDSLEKEANQWGKINKMFCHNRSFWLHKTLYHNKDLWYIAGFIFKNICKICSVIMRLT